MNGMRPFLRKLGAFAKTRLAEASTFAGLAYLMAEVPHGVELGVLCALLAVILPERRK